MDAYNRRRQAAAGGTLVVLCMASACATLLSMNTDRPLVEDAGSDADAEGGLGSGDAPTSDGPIAADAPSDAGQIDLGADASSDAAPGDAAPADDVATDVGVVSIPGLAGYWSFEEGMGTTAKDSSGNGHNGTLNGSATWGAGKVGNCVVLNSASQGYVEIPATVVDPTMPYTVSAWVNLTSISSYQTIVSIDGTLVSAFFFQQRNPGGGGFFSLTVRNETASSTPPAALAKAPTIPGTWTHFTGVFTPTNISLYVNGDFNNNGTSPPMVTAGPYGHTFIGRSWYKNRPADYTTGSVDEVRLYNRALTAIEIKALYNNSVGTSADGGSSPDASDASYDGSDTGGASDASSSDEAPAETGVNDAGDSG
jgi:hypothetical protein